jgi:hypothetical protein
MSFKRITIIGITIHIATMGITMLIDTTGTVTTVTGSGDIHLLLRAAIRRPRVGHLHVSLALTKQ